MKKIIYFGDLSYIDLFIKPISSHFKKTEYTFILITNTKIFNQKIENSIYNIFDVRDYSLLDLKILIQKLNPSIFILSNYKSLLNLIFLMLFKTLGVKTIFIQHGVFDDKLEKLKTNNYLFTTEKYISFFKLYFQFIRFKNQTFIYLLKQLYNLYIKHDLKASYGCIDNAIVYTTKDIELINKRLGISKSKILLSGYPIFDYSKDCKIFFDGSKLNTGIVLLLQQPFLFKSKSFSHQEELKYYQRINNICNRLNKKLIVKLHPLEKIENFSSFNEFKEITFNANRKDNIYLTQNAEIILAVNSTAIFYGVLLKKPIVLISYLNLKNNYLNFKKIGLLPENEDELEDILLNKDLLNSKIDAYDQFISENIGIKNSYENLAKTLLNIIE